MLIHCLLITISWLTTARSQYISTGGPAGDIIQDLHDSAIKYAQPYAQYFNLATRNEAHIENLPEQFYPMENIDTDISRNKRQSETEDDQGMAPMNFADTDKTVYLVNGEGGSPFVVNINDASGEENSTGVTETAGKRDFSPWGGKRDSYNEQTWIWKRGSNLKDANMPKRVRFSPWGGKRSGQLIMKNGEPRGTKLIFSSTIPELTKIISGVKGPINFDGYQVIHTLDKRHPINYLTLDERTLKEAMPFKTFLDYLPTIFKSGHTYTDVNFKKDGKRKVKFSAWGGKRSPPVIGPVWTAPRDSKGSSSTTIYLLKNMKQPMI